MWRRWWAAYCWPLMFVLAGFGKIGGFERTAAAIAGKGLPLPEVGAAIAIAVELGGGLMLIVGWKARWAALALAVFTVVATFFFHDFWNLPMPRHARTRPCS